MGATFGGAMGISSGIDSCGVMNSARRSVRNDKKRCGVQEDAGKVIKCHEIITYLNCKKGEKQFYRVVWSDKS